MKTISVDGTINVDDMLRALGLAEIPQGCELSMNDEVEVAVVADADALRDELDEDDEDEILLDQTCVMDLAAAIRRGDTGEAEAMLDRVFGDFAAADKIRDWIQMGRFSRKAKVGAQERELRKAA